MNRRELINAVASHIDAEARDVDRVLSGFTDVVTSTVARGEQVAISGFAKFAKVERAARMGRNPATGEPIHIKASKKARITPQQAVFVGDTVWDVRACQRAGVPCIALRSGGISTGELLDAGAVAVFADPADLLESTAGRLTEVLP